MKLQTKKIFQILLFCLLPLFPAEDLQHVLPGNSFILHDIKNRSLYIETPEEEVEYLITIARSSWIKRNWQKTLNLYLKARDKAIEINSKELEIEAINDLRKLYFSYGFYNRAIDLTREMLEYYKKKKENKHFVETQISMARFYMALSEYDKCEKILDDAFKKSVEYNYISGKANIYLIKANLQIILKDYKKSLQTIEKTYTLFKENPGYNSELNIALINSVTGINKENLGLIEEAEEHYYYALEIYQENDHKNGLVNTYNNLASVNRLKKKYKEALNFQLKSLEISKENQDTEQLKDSYLYLYGIYSAMANFDKANDCLDKYWDMRKETEDAEKISTIEKKFEIEKREIEGNLAKVKLSEEQTLKNVIIFSFVFLFILMFLIFYILLKKKTINQIILEEEKIRAELKSLQSRMNPHFIFNALSSASSLISFKPDSARKMLINLSNLLRYTLRKAQQNFVYLHEEIDICKRYLEIEKIRLGNRLIYNLAISDNLRNVLIPPLLIQPLVENSVKHGISDLENGGTIRLICSEKNKKLNIIIEDNGKGFNHKENDYTRLDSLQKKTGSGIGLSSTKNRLALLYKDDYDFEITNENGVKININIPLKIATLAGIS